MESATPSLMGIFFYLAASVYMLLRWLQSRNNKEALKTTTVTESAKVQLRVDQKYQDMIEELHKNNEKLRAEMLELRASLLERADRQDRQIQSAVNSLKLISTKVGIEWVDEVTIVKGKP